MSSGNTAPLAPIRGALFFSFTTLGDESCLVWGQSLMSPGQNEFTPAGDGLAVWVRNAGLMGERPAWGWTCGLPPFPGLRQSSKTSPDPPLAQVAHLHTCGFSWGSFSFLGQGVLQRPLLGRQTRRGFFPSAWGTQVSDTPASLQGTASSRLLPITLGAASLQLISTKQPTREPRDLTETEGRSTEAPCPPTPAVVHSLRPIS